ncbi:bifunctional phosphoglucose/phosphomannose isomerase [candidate division GN15 bacterium]|nr:bifunctional phosphoglucose/phosphomannose isomerase [candidate division GN15 bacterium]
MKSTDISILDDVEKIRSFDPGNMYNRIFDLPEQVNEALKMARGWNVSSGDFPDVRNIVLVGMGGSAIGGDLVRAYLQSDLLVPFSIIRGYGLPEYVDDETLVIASSYSGNTEETLAALDDALQRKALIAVLSTGGMMADVAELNDLPMLTLPGGMQPRAALAYSFVPLLLFFEKIGLVKGVSGDLTAAADKLSARREKYIEDNPLISNPAKHIADSIKDRIAIVYGGPGFTGVVAQRWKGQICENGKNMAFANEFPECNHNELVGWTKSVIEPFGEKLVVFMLRDADDHPKIRKRMNIVKAIVENCGAEVHDVHSMGEKPLERMFSLIQLGDFASYYLAVLNEVDPTPVDVIERLKKALAE